jgi:hypothetical protein
MEAAGLQDIKLTSVNQMSWSAIGTRPAASPINEEAQGAGL